MTGKMAQIVKRSFNGDADKVDPAVHRTLYAVADEMDDWRGDMLREVKGVRKMLMGLTGSVITGILLLIGQVLLKL